MESNPLFDLLDSLAPRLGFDRERFERFICWAQYLHYADLNMRRWLAWGESKGESEADGELVALQAAFYASMYVVVEGWGQVPLSDPYIDELLAANPQYVELLKRYRNSVFHYQPSFAEIQKRRFGLQAGGESAVDWLCLLHLEFCRVYWQVLPRAEPPRGPSAGSDRYARRAAELASKIRDCMLSLVGWIPTRIVPAKARELREVCEAGMARLREAGDFESEEALRLLEVLRQGAAGATEAEFQHEKLKRETIERVRASAPAGRERTERAEPSSNQGRSGKPRLQ